MDRQDDVTETDARSDDFWVAVADGAERARRRLAGGDEQPIEAGRDDVPAMPAPSAPRTVLTDATGQYFLMSMCNNAGGMNAKKIAGDALAAQNGDRLALGRLRRAAGVLRRPLRRRPLALEARCASRPARRPREHRSSRSRTSRGSPGRPSGDDPEPEPVALGGRR